MKNFLSFSQNQTACNFVVADSDNHQTITECSIYSRNGELNRDSDGKFTMNCNLNDSLLVIASGYEHQFIKCNRICDTVFLKTNQIELEEVTVSGQKKKTKSFYFGSRKKKLDAKTAYGFDIFNKQKLITIFPNNTGKSLRVEEGYIFLEKIDTIQPNLLITFYENKNGQLGSEIAKGITVHDQDKKRTWFQLNLNDQKIKIPENGIIITIENYNLKPNTLYLGMNEYNDSLMIKTYTVVDNVWYELPLTNDSNEERKHFGVKFYFKVK